METRDTAGVIAPPPLIFGGAFLLGLGLDALSGFPGLSLAWPLRELLGFGLIGGGAALFAKAARLFRAAGTRIEPWQPTTAMVTDGVYGRTRNPIYVALALVHAGLALVCDAIFALLALVPTLVVVDRFVILREEIYLLARFGEPYRRYLGAVRRWL